MLSRGVSKYCIFSLWPDSSESSKFRIPLKSTTKTKQKKNKKSEKNLSLETCSLMTKQVIKRISNRLHDFNDST